MSAGFGPVHRRNAAVTETTPITEAVRVQFVELRAELIYSRLIHRCTGWELASARGDGKAVPSTGVAPREAAK